MAVSRKAVVNPERTTNRAVLRGGTLPETARIKTAVESNIPASARPADFQLT
jgi:hypothetical protein